MLGKVVRAVKGAILMDRVKSLVRNEKYKEAIELYERSAHEPQEWRLPFLMAECYWRCGNDKKMRYHLEMFTKDFFSCNFNVFEKRHMAIFIFKRYGYVDDRVKRLYREEGYDNYIDDSRVRRELKDLAPMRDTI